jgi:hypothetical protein
MHVILYQYSYNTISVCTRVPTQRTSLHYYRRPSNILERMTRLSCDTDPQYETACSNMCDLWRLSDNCSSSPVNDMMNDYTDTSKCSVQFCAEYDSAHVEHQKRGQWLERFKTVNAAISETDLSEYLRM